MNALSKDISTPLKCMSWNLFGFMENPHCKWHKQSKSYIIAHIKYSSGRFNDAYTRWMCCLKTIQMKFSLNTSTLDVTTGKKELAIRTCHWMNPFSWQEHLD